MENKIFLENLERKKKAIGVIIHRVYLTIKMLVNTASTKQNQKFVVEENHGNKRNG
jgi:hypothetical protein